MCFSRSDNSDELQCAAQCLADETYCPQVGCIRFSRFCDGIVDCADGSDEHKCDDASGRRLAPANGTDAIDCAVNEWSCDDRRQCVARIRQCDGVPDCIDLSDELHCLANKQRPLYNESLGGGDENCVHPDRVCQPTGLCVGVHQVCDGNIDCVDGSDEGGRCDEKVCDHTTECSHYCNNAPEGFVCSCPAHMFLTAGGRQCSVEHACEHWGTCAQVCKPLGKRYVCACEEGYRLERDRFSCKSTSHETPYVIFSNRQEIKSVDLRTLAVRDLFTALRNTIALDFLIANGSVQLFWTDVIDDKIYR